VTWASSVSTLIYKNNADGHPLQCCGDWICWLPLFTRSSKRCGMHIQITLMV